MSSGLAIIMLVFVSTSCGNDPPEPTPGPRTPAEKFRSLSAEYDREVKKTLEASKAVGTATTQRFARPDPTVAQTYARRFVELARECPDESVAVDALTWVMPTTAMVPWSRM